MRQNIYACSDVHSKGNAIDWQRPGLSKEAPAIENITVCMYVNLEEAEKETEGSKNSDADKTSVAIETDTECEDEE